MGKNWKREKKKCTTKIVNEAHKVHRFLFNLEILKWAARSGHVSQSSPVILYMFAISLISLAIGGVALAPGDKENTSGRFTPLRSCTNALNMYYLRLSTL